MTEEELKAIREKYEDSDALPFEWWSRLCEITEVIPIGIFIEEAKKDIFYLIKEIAFQKGIARRLQDCVDYKDKEIVRLRNTLEFYARPETYETFGAIGFFAKHRNGKYFNEEKVKDDIVPWARARNALGEK